MTLREQILTSIARNGPISVSDYMHLCLHDANYGYYANHPALGANGDFITAPLVSQMFGEMLGVWTIAVWWGLGRPARVRLVELGPGDGTLMSDMLRSARAAPEFLDAAEVWLVETSTPLRSAQANLLSHKPLEWVGAIGDIPSDEPIIMIANEFLDCLPVEQWVRRGGEMLPRRIGLDESGELAFVVDSRGSKKDGHEEYDLVIEHSASLERIGREAGQLIRDAQGAAVFIDYGPSVKGIGDTLQAIKQHKKEGPLVSPGEADLTVHVDFPRFVEAARKGGACTAPLETQGAFLVRLGIEARASALRTSNPDRAGLIDRQLHRLVNRAQMGELFKVACLHSAGLRLP